MSSHINILNRHLQYRLWIAELDSLVEQIRVLNDHMIELPSVVKKASGRPDLIEKSLTDLRQPIDDLRNKMHLRKMELAAMLKNDPLTKPDDARVFGAMEKEYQAIRLRFDSIKAALTRL